MNTKFDVGQRVTYPVVHTADGNITGIAVSKAGVTRYAIGPKWYAEEDLKLAAEEKPATESVKESEPEPVKLYGIKDNSGWVTKGKIYEFVDGNIRFDEFFGGKLEYESFEKFKEYNTGLSACLVPLVRRPAKVGEWVYICNAGFAPCGDNGVPTYKNGDVMKIIGIEWNNNWFRYRKGSNSHGTEYVLNQNEYLVLDGYTGDPT